MISRIGCVTCFIRQVELDQKQARLLVVITIVQWPVLFSVYPVPIDCPLLVKVIAWCSILLSVVKPKPKQSLWQNAKDKLRQLWNQPRSQGVSSSRRETLVWAGHVSSRF